MPATLTSERPVIEAPLSCGCWLHQLSEIGPGIFTCKHHIARTVPNTVWKDFIFHWNVASK